MTTNLAQVERAAFCDASLAAGPDAPTLCEGWAVRDLAAHVVVREGRLDLAPAILLPIGQDRLEREQGKIAAGDFPSLIETVRTGPPVWNPARISAIDTRMNLMEFVVHTEDVVRGDGIPGPRRDVPEAVVKATWATLRSMARLMFRRSPVGVTLIGPGYGEVAAVTKDGPGVTLTGAPLELTLTAYGRDGAAETRWEGDPAAIEALRATSLGI
ncbi:MAG: TIGR03085 family protein [Phycicoccus sp.]|nr:TIGR03085 family protein [Phycicoccus sp.]